MKLTPKQKAFADYYIISLNATDAAKKAGYSEKTARFIGAENLSKPYIRLYIDEALKKKDSERIMAQDELMERYTRLARGEDTEETIVVMNNRYERVRKEPSFKDQLKAMDALAKIYALYTTNINHSGDMGLHINVDYGDPDENS